MVRKKIVSFARLLCQWWGPTAGECGLHDAIIGTLGTAIGGPTMDCGRNYECTMTHARTVALGWPKFQRKFWRDGSRDGIGALSMPGILANPKTNLEDAIG